MHQEYKDTITWNKIKQLKLEAKDAFKNINYMQAAKTAKKCRFCPW